jgi:purine-nucleoside phosphorylase
MDFKKFFAISPEEFSENCIICQSSDLSLFADNARNGLFVKTAKIKNATIIGLRNNFAAGDSVLFLENTPCRNIILFGSCGVCGDIDLGSPIAVEKSYNLESFSKMALCKSERSFEYSNASKEFNENFFAKNPNLNFIKTNSACVNSFILQPQYLDFFKEKNIGAVDMESSIVFCAAKIAKINAACFMYASDHIEKYPLGKNLAEPSKKRIGNTRKKLAKAIAEFFFDKN